MDIPINAKVSCSDGLFGQSTHVIIMPTTENITHVVVVNGAYPETGYLVPVDRIVESTPELISSELHPGRAIQDASLQSGGIPPNQSNRQCEPVYDVAGLLCS